MREIKFRAWIADRQEMSKPFGLLDIDSGFAAPDGDWGKSFDLEEAPPIMQFTGYYDVNGREIYEGDVVRGQGAKNYRIEYHYGCYGGMVGADETGEGSVRLAHIESPVVLGNIYENPELVKVDEVKE
jgi:uncharacterized phage protein (TIGR01671 family)